MMNVVIHNRITGGRSHFLHDGTGKFISVIDDDVCMSSMPLASDVDEMVAHNVKSVVNMQMEWEGLKLRMSALVSSSCALPTIDSKEPSYDSLVAGIKFIRRRMQEEPGSKVLIHCKGGRGRASAMTLAYLLSKGFKPLRKTQPTQINLSAVFLSGQRALVALDNVPEMVRDIIKHMKAKRSVVELSVATHAPVLQVHRQFIGAQ